ncbi:hypothetical protein, partial [Janthinobacterium sp.]|uniref:hypothetical protein n=1 Tax=Janthinobacterium sp. TaxID=1871054 RepID=UPI002582A3FB
MKISKGMGGRKQPSLKSEWWCHGARRRSIKGKQAASCLKADGDDEAGCANAQLRQEGNYTA